jgi:cholesterol oxidase
LPTAHGESCDSDVCRRITFLFGRLYQHAQLSPATHDALPELFGRSSVAAFEQLAAVVRRRHVVSSSGGNDYLPHLERLAIPITFIHGALNRCYLPESTEATYSLLCQRNDPSLYERHVVPRYGHIDCIFGKNTAIDIFPLIRRHLDRVAS